MSDVTRLLEAMHRDDTHAGERLFADVYGELLALARSKMAREKPGHTLQPTALVHEAWLRLHPDGSSGGQSFKNRAHFFGAAAEAMRRILIERARRKLAVRHGGGIEHVDADGIEIAMVPGKEEELIAVHDALDALAAHDERKAAVVKLHYFAGFSLTEAADVLGISEPTARRDWSYSRAWLRREIERA